MYKLKPEARKFFSKDLSIKIKGLDFWAKNTIHENLLDKVDDVYVEYGIKIGENTTSLAGWESNDGNPRSKFHFTIHVNEISIPAYQNMDIPHLMDEIQDVIKKHIRSINP